MNHPITIGRLIPMFTGKFGGPYNHIMDLTSYLKKMGIKTNIYTTSYVAQKGRERTYFFEKKSKNFNIYRFHSFLKFREYRISFKFFPFLLKEAKNIDLFHSHAVRTFQEDIGCLISLMKKKPVIITPHGGISINWDYGDKIPKMIHDKLIGYLKRKLLKPHFIAVSKNEISIIKKFGIDNDYIHYIPDGVNTQLYRYVDPTDLKKKYNVEESDIILYVGRINKGKGVDKLIKILNFIVQKNKNVKLFIIGEDSGYLHVVKSLIYKYNLSDYVIFTGFISRYNLAKYYSMADLVVYPSRQEIFGHVIIESGACGRVVIGSDIMGPSEIIIDGKTGFTSDFKNYTELSDLILELLNDKKRLIQMGKEAIERVKAEFSWEKSAISHIELYKKVLNSD